MHPADKALLRLAVGVGLATAVAYGLSMKLPFVACVMAVVMLARPGPPIPFVKGVVVAFVVTLLLVMGLLMVPLLRHYRVAGLLLTAVFLFLVFRAGARKANPLTMILVIAMTAIPVAGVFEQALAIGLGKAIGIGLGVGILVSGVSHVFFPDAGGAAKPAPPGAGPQRAAEFALQATLVVMPAFVLALTNPALYIPPVLKSVALGQQTGAAAAGGAGRELVGSTLMGAAMAVVVWCGLSLLPSLWMLVLWIMAATFWAGARLVRLRATRFAPSFWVNALITMFILLGPGIEDAAVGKDVYLAGATRVLLFVLVSLYAWALVWLIARWRRRRAGLQAGAA